MLTWCRGRRWQAVRSDWWRTIGLGGVLVTILFTGQGCGTISHGSRQNILISSNPPGAVVIIDGYAASTPTKVSLARTRDYVATFEQDGYEKKQVMIVRSFNGWATIAGNLLWLLPGIILDLGTGGAWTLEPEIVNVTLNDQGDVGERRTWNH